MKTTLLTITLCFVMAMVGCKKEETNPVTVTVTGSGKHYVLSYLPDGEMYTREKLVDSAYTETFYYKTGFKYIFTATVRDTFGYVVLKVTDGNKHYYDSIYGSPGVGARVY